jgi:hypothetical protein
LGENLCKSPHILREKSQKSPYLDKEFLKVAKNKKNILAKFGSFLLWMIASSPTQPKKNLIFKEKSLRPMTPGAACC